ncbi:MAG: hypothetical protein ACON4U_15935 [Myxococcota bacterium]
MQLLVISLVVLFIGYFCTSFIRGQTRVLLALHGFLKTLVIGIILMEMIPLCAEVFGWTVALAFFLAGWLMITLAERTVTQTERSTPIVVAIALSLHAVLDGVLFTESHQAETAALAVVLHRLPMGILIACYPLKKSVALILLFGISLSTLVGYMGSQSLPVESLTLLQGLSGGSLLHIVYTHNPKFNSPMPPDFWLRIGMILGTVGLVIVFATHSHDHQPPPLLWLGISTLVLLLVFIRPSLQHAHVMDQPTSM